MVGLKCDRRELPSGRGRLKPGGCRQPATEHPAAPRLWRQCWRLRQCRPLPCLLLLLGELLLGVEVHSRCRLLLVLRLDLVHRCIAQLRGGLLVLLLVLLLPDVLAASAAPPTTAAAATAPAAAATTAPATAAATATAAAAPTTAALLRPLGVEGP